MPKQAQLFQGFIGPDKSGQLPKAEGSVIFQQTIISLGAGLIAPGNPLIPADGFFLKVIQAFFQIPNAGGGQVIFGVFPKATQAADIAKLFTVNNPAIAEINGQEPNAFFPVASYMSIAPAWFCNGSAAGDPGKFVIYGVQLQDCPPYNRGEF